MCYKIQVKYSILVNDVISKRAKDIVSAWHCCYRLSRLIVLCQFANWLWIRSRSGDHLSVSGRLSGLSPAKHETNELFSMAHTRKIYNVNEALKHDWWKSLQQHNQQYHILFLVTFPYLVTSGTWFNHWSLDHLQ